MKPLRIAILAPIKRPITPDTTVSRARVIVDLAQGLMKKGHQVSLFATEDSLLPGAKIVGITSQGLNFMPPPENPFYRDTAYLTMMIKRVEAMQNDFDVIHNHMYPEYLPLLALSNFKIPFLTTVHSQMTEETKATLKLFPEAQLIAISEMSKKTAGIPAMTVIHNSINTDLFRIDPNSKRDYVLFVGRMSKAKDAQGNFLDPKGVTHAIKLAQVTGERLKIVGNVEDTAFFETLIKPHLSEKIEFVGEVSPEQLLTREQIVALFQGAKAFINPINWQEPFGLVMAEALACGTPVIAFDRGAVSEIVKDGEVGFVVDPEQGIEGLQNALGKLSAINHDICREYAVKHFSTERMVSEYEMIYQKIL